MRAVNELLTECCSMGIRIQADGRGGLHLDAPMGLLRPAIIAKLKEHKREILTALQEPVNPAIGNDPSKYVEDSVPISNSADEAIVCKRCDSAEYMDVSIHDGRSLRRDCATCGRFLYFSKWYGQDTLHNEQYLIGYYCG